MSVLGIDLGSRAVKVVVFDNNKLKYSKVFGTSEFYREYCRNTGNKLNVDFERIASGTFEKIISTGYGRNNVNIEGAEVILELKAHTFGAVWQTGLDEFTLLDVGGQDSKVISVKQGKVSDLILNDKCAASCGRYLENMANVIGLQLSEMEKYYDNPVELSSTCAVFAESELIGRISEGYSHEELAAGVNYSLFKRIKPLIERFPAHTLVITGGVAKNKGLIHFIEEQMSFKSVIVPEEPQLNGAIGCCLRALGK